MCKGACFGNVPRFTLPLPLFTVAQRAVYEVPFYEMVGDVMHEKLVSLMFAFKDFSYVKNFLPEQICAHVGGLV